MSYQEDVQVIIIGAGAGGLACAIRLKQQHNFKNFMIYEQAHDVGGTWRDNVYPGCSSDVNMCFYSLSTDLHDWKQSHGTQEDIKNYWRGLAEKYDIVPHILFGSSVIAADWNEDLQSYKVKIENTTTKERREVIANIVISAVGALSIPNFSIIPGAADFKGDCFHSARWNKEVDLRNKNVAVIGNGASATQFVPCITKDPTVNVIEFCRTPNWMTPPIRVTFSPLRRWVFRNIPFLKRLERWSGFAFTEFFYFSVFWSKILRPFIKKSLISYMEKTAPPEYHDQLIPNFEAGCKRIIFDTDYYNALHRPNLELNWDGIDRIVEDGIVTKKGVKIPFDVIIFATGYNVNSYPIDVRGRNGQTLKDYYASEGGPKAYLGTSIPGFPNFCLIFGPNTATGHTSVIYTNEIQIDYIIKLIKPILNSKLTSIDVTKEATDSYNNMIQKRFSNSNSVFSGCASWYRIGGTGKVTNIFPGSGTYFWYLLRKPVWKNYTGPGMQTWLSKVRRTRMIRAATFIACAILLFPLGTARMGLLPNGLRDLFFGGKSEHWSAFFQELSSYKSIKQFLLVK